MTRWKLGLYQRRNMVNYKGKKFILDKEIYNRQQKLIDLSLKVYFFVAIIFEAMWYFHLLKLWLFISVVAAVIIAGTVVLTLSLPKDIEKYMTPVNDNQ